MGPFSFRYIPIPFGFDRGHSGIHSDSRDSGAEHMQITHYRYNAFLVEEGDVKIAIDPGQNLWLFKLKSLIPQSEWPSVTHIVITHGDPDHHWQSDRIAQASGAPVVCGTGLTKVVDGRTLVIDPRGKALTSWVHFENLHPLDVGESVELDGVAFEAIRSYVYAQSEEIDVPTQ